MFDRILIANRGEIACRVIATARRMGVETVAVHSQADAGARHVRLADIAVAIGPPEPARSYLDIERIVAAARETGAQAVHPGYGFLSENPDFVEALEAAGIVFVGPSAAAIRAMGLKDAAKATMEAAGVPVVPGYHGPDQSPERLAAAAAEVGYPVLVKAVAGGGGKGMRVVRTPADFDEALAAARGEAQAAFGNDAVLIEKFVATPRHIEVQVFGDGRRALHLFERDCSLQRRHQKVIEEAPAPGMSAAMRAEMGAAAVRAAEAIGYAGAGTVEFIADASEGLRADRFYFMEMNTRLQVEHPVTEAITGVDLVEWQLRVAAGEPLPAAQDDLAITGHAMEARLYAEDAENGFLPATGRLHHLRFPDGVRADSGVETGDVITPWYDPMIAKLIVHGPDRETARRRLVSALERTEVAGTVTNLRFLARLAAQEDFAAGAVDTGLIERDHAALTAPEAPPRTALALAALEAAGLSGPAVPFQGFALWAPGRTAVRLRHGGQVQELGLTVEGPDRAVLEAGGEAMALTRSAAGWAVDGRREAAGTFRQGDEITVFLRGAWRFEMVDPLAVGPAAAAAPGRIEAPMPGVVKAVLVAPGAQVAQGDRLAIVEAMKMEHTMRAPAAGVVAEVRIEDGAQVAAGDLLIRLEEVL